MKTEVLGMGEPWPEPPDFEERLPLRYMGPPPGAAIDWVDPPEWGADVPEEHIQGHHLLDVRTRR